MRRILSLVLAITLSLVLQPLPTWADSTQDLRSALYEMRKGDWNTALRVAGQHNSVTRDFIVCHWLHVGFGSSGAVLVFLDHRTDWPGLAWQRRKSEPSFTRADTDRVLKFHAAVPPHTAEGALNYAIALKNKGHHGKTEADIVTAWRTRSRINTPEKN